MQKKAGYSDASRFESGKKVHDLKPARVHLQGRHMNVGISPASLTLSSQGWLVAAFVFFEP